MEPIHIDGSEGEGGGQVVRTSLALSLVTGRPIRIERIRARRSKPGLMRQHLTCVRAAQAVGDARVEGDEVGSSTLSFTPRTVSAGDYRFSVGTAGSTTLVAQTILPALFAAKGPSTIVLEGGTHNPLAPSADYLSRVYLPLLARMGLSARVTLERHGFYPAGGGRLRIDVQPGRASHFQLVDRGAHVASRARAIFSRLPFDVAKRELATLERALGWPTRPHEVDSAGPGNVVELEVEHTNVTELFYAFGERGLSAETVAQQAIDEANAYLAHDAPVGPHLADQLLLPMALGEGGTFRTAPLTLHTETQLQLIPRFLNVTLTHDAGVVWVRS